jgi:hypothetical protein
MTHLWVSESHHAEGLVNPKVRAKKRLLILDTPEHVDSEYIKFKIGPWTFLYQLVIIDRFSYFFRLFSPLLWNCFWITRLGHGLKMFGLEKLKFTIWHFDSPTQSIMSPENALSGKNKIITF